MSKLAFYESQIIEEYLETIISIRGLSRNYGVSRRLIRKVLESNNIKIIRKPFTEAAKKKMSMSTSGKNHPMFGKHPSEETKKKISNTLTGRTRSEETKKKISDGNKGKIISEETKKKLSKANSGKNNPNFGKHASKETKRKQSEAHLGNHHSEGTKRKMLGKCHSEKTKIKMSIAQSGENNPMFGKHHSEKTRKAQSESKKDLWQTPEYIQKQMKSRGSVPNKTELYLQDLLTTWVPNQFKFVGDGEFILAGKCPDFINVNGKKQIIELYGDYWHRNDNPQDRIDLFANYGYKTLVIWELEINTKLEKVRQKVLEFVYG